METFGRERRKVDEISFILQNIFIMHPNQGSKYKIRVIVNRNNREHPFKKIDNRYTFQLPPSKDLPSNSCFMVLLEKSTKKGTEGQYLEIGKGELELADAAQANPNGKESVVNGVIYGTRSFNYDRIIGKYSYKIFKNQVQAVMKESRGKESKKISFVDHKKKQKMPEFAFKKSIIEHSNEINSKIKQLTKSMNQIIGNPKDQETFESHAEDRHLPAIKEAIFQDNDYFYKYNPKIEEQIKDNTNSKKFKVLMIKNIRLESSQKSIKETDQSLAKPTMAKRQKTKSVEVVIIFYQLFEDKKLRKRLLQIYLALNYGQDNRLLANNWFYLPNSDKKILIEVAIVSSSYNKDRSLNGVIELSHAKSRLIELIDTSNQESGIVICQLQNCHEIDKEEIKGYGRQVQKFQKYMRRYNCEFSHFVKKPTEIKEEAPQKSVILDNSAQDTLYSNFHPKKKVDPLRRNRYKTEANRSVQLDSITPSVSVSRNNFTSLSEKPGKRKLMTRGSSFEFEPRSKRAYPSDSETVVGLNRSKVKDQHFSDLSQRFRLYLQSVQLNLYGLDAKNKKVVLKFEMNDQSQIKKIFFTSDKQSHPLHLQYKAKRLTESLSIFLLVHKTNTTNYYKIGKCHIPLNQFKESRSHRFKAFISKENKINAYVVLNFKMFREKSSDEKTQSFYYQEQYDRERSLLSQGEQNQRKEDFSNFSETQIPFKQTVFQRNQDIEFQMSVDSNRISNARNTQVHYISQRMSDKAPSEVLEEEEYQNGLAVQKKQY